MSNLGYTEEYWKGVKEGQKHAAPSKETANRLNSLDHRLERHLEIYASNGKELEAVKTNQAWLMKFFFIFMTPTLSSLVYIVFNI